MKSTSWETLGLDEAQPGLKIASRNINNLRYAGDTTLMAESEEVKNLPAKTGDIREVGLIPGLGTSPGEGRGNPLQYS